MSDDYKCSGCGQTKVRKEFHETHATDRARKVTSRCRECRSETYFKKRYPELVCVQCLKHRKVDSNKICRKCNEECGLRQCNGPCGQLLAIHVSFYQGRKCCTSCSRGRSALGE